MSDRLFAPTATAATSTAATPATSCLPGAASRLRICRRCRRRFVRFFLARTRRARAPRFRIPRRNRQFNFGATSIGRCLGLLAGLEISRLQGRWSSLVGGLRRLFFATL